MCFSIHLFELAKINSEIKYVANSVNRAAPPYALPAVSDYQAWQKGILQSLDSWMERTPTAQPGKEYARILCQIQYHNIRMLATRPSPAIPIPSAVILTQCYNSAASSVRLYDQLYKQDILIASWTVLHCITMSAVSMMYCLRMAPNLAENTPLELLLNDISICTNLLSAIGEHWSAAKRCRIIISELGGATVRLVKTRQSASNSDASQEPQASDIHTVALSGVEGDFDTMFGNSDFLLDELRDSSNFFDLTWIGDHSTEVNTIPFNP
jgi:hypothetical protein